MQTYTKVRDTENCCSTSGRERAHRIILHKNIQREEIDEEPCTLKEHSPLWRFQLPAVLLCFGPERAWNPYGEPKDRSNLSRRNESSRDGSVHMLHLPLMFVEETEGQGQLDCRPIEDVITWGLKRTEYKLFRWLDRDWNSLETLIGYRIGRIRGWRHLPSIHVDA